MTKYINHHAERWYFFPKVIQGNPQKKMSDGRKSFCPIFKHHNYSVPMHMREEDIISKQHTSQWL